MSSTITREELLRALSLLPKARLARIVEVESERLGRCDVCDTLIPVGMDVCAECEEETLQADAADAANDAVKVEEEES